MRASARAWAGAFMNVTRYKCSALAIDNDPGTLSVLYGQLGADFEIVTATTAEQAPQFWPNAHSILCSPIFSYPTKQG